MGCPVKVELEFSPMLGPSKVLPICARAHVFRKGNPKRTGGVRIPGSRLEEWLNRQERPESSNIAGDVFATFCGHRGEVCRMYKEKVGSGV